jgi:hypothetical protein
MLTWLNQWWPVLAFGASLFGALVIVVATQFHKKNERISSLERCDKYRSDTIIAYAYLTRWLQDHLGWVLSFPVIKAERYLQVMTTSVKFPSGLELFIEAKTELAGEKYSFRYWADFPQSSLPAVLRGGSPEFQLENKVRCLGKFSEHFFAPAYDRSDVYEVAEQLSKAISLYEKEWPEIKLRSPEYNKRVLAAAEALHATNSEFESAKKGEPLATFVG